MTGTLVAEMCGFSQSKLSKIETGRVVPAGAELQRLLAVIKADGELAKKLLEKREAISSEIETWRLLHLSGFAKHQQRIAEIEDDVSCISVFQTAVIPGLLQTEDYARAVIRNASGHSADADAVKARLDRQKILDDSSKRFRFVLTEAVLMWRYTENSSHIAQLEHLLCCAGRHNVDVQIFGFGKRLTSLPLHSFCLYDDRLVTVELFNSQASFVEGDIVAYIDEFDRLMAASRKITANDFGKQYGRLL